MPELETPVPPVKQPPIQMGVPLSRQTAQLTKLLADRPAEAPKAPETSTQPETPAEVPKAPEQVYEPEEEPVAAKPVELGPLNKYVMDKLPTLTTRIKDGDSVKVITFKDVSELPAGFELADDTARAQFTIDVTAQFGRAKDAVAQYKQAELNEQVRQFDAQEAKDVEADLRRLQKAGIIPKFEKEENDPDFNDDPGVKTANAIYKLFKSTNDAYRKAGKVYRVTYADAADKYFAGETRRTNAADASQKAKEQPEPPKKTAKKEPSSAEKERNEIAKKTGAPSHGEAEAGKPRVRSGMRMSDIVKLANMGKI